MSADNWRTCPNCLKKAQEEKAAKINEVEESYGKISKKKYDLLVKESEKPVELEDTLREDYSIGVYEDGEFCVSYSCSCQNCSFSHKYAFGQKLDVDKITAENHRKNNR